MNNKKLILVILVCLALIILGFVITANAQVNQIEGKFIYHPHQDKIFNTDGYGVGITLTTNLGEYIKLINSIDFEKSVKGDIIESFKQRDITLQSTVRLYPIESYYSIKPFVQGGVKARFNKFQANTLVELILSPGFLTADQKNTFTSPIIGVGINIKDFYIVDYSHLFPDFSSKTEFFLGQPSFFKERGDIIQVKGFIPIGHKFLFIPNYQISRTKFEFFPYQWDHKVGFGLSLKIK